MADLSLPDYGSIKPVNILEGIQAQSYNLDVAKKAREYTALQTEGLAAAQGDTEAAQRLFSKHPEAASTLANIDHTLSVTRQQKEQTKRQFVSSLAAELSQIPDPTQQMAVLGERLAHGEQQKIIHPDIANHYRREFARNPNALPAMIYQNLGATPEKLPGIVGQTAMAQVPAEGRKQQIIRSMQKPEVLDLPDPTSPFGHKPVYVPGHRLPGAWGGEGDVALPPVFPGAPGAMGLPAAPRTGPDYRPGAVTVKPIGAPGEAPEGTTAPATRSLRREASDGVTGSGPVAQMIKAETAKHDNLNEELTQVTAAIESGHGTVPDRAGSQYRGVFQLGDAERARWGGSGIPQGIQSLSNRKRELTQILGREPENWEVYMAHQQGSAGASKLINNPDTPAGQLTKPRYISANGGNPDAPASQFVDKWRQQYETRAARYRGAAAPAAAAPGAATVAPAAAAPGAATAPEAPAATPEAAAAAPEAAARPSAAGAPPRSATQFGLYVGDSITAQQIRNGGEGTEDAPNKGQPIQPGVTAGIGDTPMRVLERITTLDKVPETVFLSSGASNAPDQIDAVGQQITDLGAKGAKYVVVPGVGPGVKNADMVNELLRDAVETPREGVKGVFFEPQVRWISNKTESGIHPAEVLKVREQGLKALERAQSSATLTDTERTTAQEPPVMGPAAQADTVVHPDRGLPADTAVHPDRGLPAVQPVAAGAPQSPDVVLGDKTTTVPFTPTQTAAASEIPGSYAAPQPELIEAAKVRQEEILGEFKEIVKESKGAAAGLISLTKLDSILDRGFVSGTFAKERQVIQQAVSTFANLINKTSSHTDRMAAYHNMFESISKQLGFDMAVSLGSREAQQIVAQVMDIKPSVLHSVAGNRAIIESLRQVFQMQLDKKKFYEARIAQPEKYYGKLGYSEDFFKENRPEVYASKAVPLQIPRDANGRMIKDELVHGAYYDATGAKDHEEGDRVLWDGNKLTHAGKPAYLRDSGKPGKK